MNRRLTASIAAAATAGALVLATAAPALAATTDTAPPVGPGSSLPVIQKAGADATAKRLASLNEAIARVNANTHLSDADRSAILATLNADIAGMNTEAAKIAADTTVSTALADYHAIFTDYRVYAVALPQSLYAAGADRLTGTALPKLQSAYDKLSAALTAHPDKSTPALQAELADMAAKIQTAQTDADGLAAAALAVTPADYNANHTVLADLRTKLRDAINAAKDAAHDGRDIAAALK